MSWGEIFFGFLGRINRKTFWFGCILVAIAGFLFNALLSYLATGNPMAPEVWEKPADKIGIWAPVWIAYFVFLAWPFTSLAVKRLYDRDNPAWIWYTYYVLLLVLSLIPPKSTAGAATSATVQILLVPLAIFSVYLFFELGALRGTPGPNEHGQDTLPAGYYGGDYSFWSWMLAVEGRISRLKWWLGILILAGIVIVVSVAMGLIVSAYIGQHPEFEQNISNPDWIRSKEAAPLVEKIAPWTLILLPVFAIIMWSLFALGVKRLHDRGLSSWLMLVVVLPFLFAIIAPSLAVAFGLGESIVHLALLLLMASAIWSVLQFGILKGDTGPNDHGPDPLAS